MLIETRDFGKIQIDSREIVQFVEPIYGFEELKEFTLLSDSEIGDCFLWLQSVEKKDCCFILVDPKVLPASYNPKFPEHSIKALQLTDDNTVLRVIAVVPDDLSKATVNLKCPVVINREKKLAGQIMLEDDFPINAALLV